MVVRTPSSSSAGSRRLSLVLALALALPAAGCSMFGDKKEEVAPDEPADQLYNEGLTKINSGDYEDARKKFDEVDRQHPYTDWGRKAVLMTTYANYKAGKYTDAITSGTRYVQLHPTSPDAAYAQYLVAMSYYNQVPDIARDQEGTRRAVESFEELVRRWPNSEYAETARRRIAVARDQLAGKEMQVGRYYLGRREYTGAINRFRIVVSQYQQTRHIEEALERLVEAYMALGIVSEAQTAAAILGHNYPDSEWYKAAYALVTNGGLQPQENSESWISKAFKGFSGGTASRQPPQQPEATVPPPPQQQAKAG